MARQRHTLDDLFQVLVRGRDIAPVAAKARIEEALRLDKLRVDFHIRGGVQSINPARRKATPRAGVTGRVHYDAWGPIFALVIEDGQLGVIYRCALDYPWNAYSFTIANWAIVDELWPSPARSANTAGSDHEAEPLAPAPEDRKRGSPVQTLIRELADKNWGPGRYGHIGTGEIMKALEPKFKERAQRVPSRDTFDRALGRRKD